MIGGEHKTVIIGVDNVGVRTYALKRRVLNHRLESIALVARHTSCAHEHLWTCGMPCGAWHGMRRIVSAEHPMLPG